MLYIAGITKNEKIQPKQSVYSTAFSYSGRKELDLLHIFGGTKFRRLHTWKQVHALCVTESTGQLHCPSLGLPSSYARPLKLRYMDAVPLSSRVHPAIVCILKLTRESTKGTLAANHAAFLLKPTLENQAESAILSCRKKFSWQRRRSEDRIAECREKAGTLDFNL